MSTITNSTLVLSLLALAALAACGGSGPAGQPFAPNITDASMASPEDVQIARRLVAMNGEDAEAETGSVSALRALRDPQAATRSASVTVSCADMDRYGNVWNGSGSITASGSYNDQTTDFSLNMAFNQCAYEGMAEDDGQSCSLRFSIHGSYRCTANLNRFERDGMNCATPSPCSGLTFRLGNKTATVGEDLTMIPYSNSSGFRTTGTICVNGNLFDVEDLLEQEPALEDPSDNLCAPENGAMPGPDTSARITLGRLGAGRTSFTSVPLSVFGPTPADRANGYFEVHKNGVVVFSRISYHASFEASGSMGATVQNVSPGDTITFVVHMGGGARAAYSGRASSSQDSFATYVE